MKTSLLMNCLWFEDISPEAFADALEITPEELFQKIFQGKDFTENEIKKTVAMLGLTDEETDIIFYR